MPNRNVPAPGSDRLISGIILVLIGSSSYGLLSTFVKLAYRTGFTTAEITTSQFVWGTLVLTLLAITLPRPDFEATRADKLKLMLAGTTTGFTSVFYYISVTSIAASLAVVLLMQSIWMGVLVECATKRRWPTLEKIVAVVLVLFGTVLATNALDGARAELDGRGLFFGVLSAISYTCTLVATGNVATRWSAVKRSQYMLFGGTIIAVGFALLTQIGPHYLDVNLVGADFVRNKPFDVTVFGTYGLLVAVFGTILPPIVLNKGFPITGVGLGSIISSVELPFATLVAFALLGERIGVTQTLGIAIIIASVFVLNFRLITKSAAGAS